MTIPYQTYAKVANLKDYGAVGDGVADDTTAVQSWIEAAWVQVEDDESSYEGINNLIAYAPPGRYRISSTININGAYGAAMHGAGRFATHFVGDADVTVFRTNGCAYTTFKDFSIAADGDCDCFQLYWQQDGYISCQSNQFENMFFSGGNTGLDIGYPNMGSENIVLNCYFINHGGQGLKTSNFNALQNQVIGGNFGSCTVGIRIGAGSVTNVTGVGFQNSVEWDIVVENSAEDTMVIDGCRTESVNFVWFAQGQPIITGCTQLNGTDGRFVEAGEHAATITNCSTTSGNLKLWRGGVVQNCEFGRDEGDWITTDTATGTVAVFNVAVGNTYIQGTPTATYDAGLFSREDQVYAPFLISGGDISVNWIKVDDFAFGDLPTPTGPGVILRVNDSNTTTWGATIAGGGANMVLAWWNGTNWTVAGR